MIFALFFSHSDMQKSMVFAVFWQGKAPLPAGPPARRGSAGEFTSVFKGFPSAASGRGWSWTGRAGGPGNPEIYVKTMDSSGFPSFHLHFPTIVF